MASLKPVLDRLKVDLTRNGFERRGRNFTYRSADGTGVAVVNIQTAVVTKGNPFFVNLATGPMAYLDWLTWVHNRAKPVMGAGGVGLWRSRLKVPPEVPKTPNPRADYHTWQFETDEDRERMLPHLLAALDRVVPRLKSLTDPRAFAGMRGDLHFWNQVQLRHPLDELLLDASHVPLAEIEARCVAAAQQDPRDAEFTRWLVERVRRQAKSQEPEPDEALTVGETTPPPT